MSDQDESLLSPDLQEFIKRKNIQLSREFRQWMECAVHKSLVELLAMTHTEYKEYINDQVGSVRNGFNNLDSMRLRLAINAERYEVNAREQSAKEELLATQKVRQHEKEAARERHNARDKHRRGEERGLHAPKVQVRAAELRDAHHEAIRYTEEELKQTDEERSADLKEFLKDSVGLPAAAVACIVHQIPRALEVVLGMTDEQIRHDIVYIRIYERKQYVVSEEEFDRLFSALNEKRQNVKLDKERRRVQSQERQRNRTVYKPVTSRPRLPPTKPPGPLVNKYDIVLGARTPNPYCVYAGGAPAPGSAR
jgi:hypothetical protein